MPSRWGWIHALLSLVPLAVGCGSSAPAGPGADGGAAADGGGDRCAIASCLPNQHCDPATGQCVCDNLCSAAGSVCDPAGSNRIGACAQDTNGCFFVSALAACPGAGQVCDPGETACKCNPSPPCTTGATRCNLGGTGTETCANDATGCPAWLPAQSCSSHQVCSPAAPGGPGCVCNDACPSAGASPDIQCAASASAYQVCTADANSCRFWEDFTCPGAQVCDPAAATVGTNPPCACPASPLCTAGEQRCNPTTGQPETCVTDAGGCPGWMQTDTCSAGFETCQLSQNVASCVCNPAPGCTGGTVGQTFCPVNGGTTFQTCSVDAASGCFFFTAAQSCPSTQQTCVAPGGNGTPGACTCPAAACQPGTGSCNGNALQICRLDVAGGCGTMTSVDCPTTYGAGSTCQMTPSPHCTCPAPTGSTLYVDAASGSDATGTGAAAPPDCALRSISKAMSQTGVGTTFTVIKARTGTYSAAATQETFPIQLRSGVTLTTDGTPSPGTPFSIEGTGAFALAPVGGVSSTIVYAGDGTARLENFTVRGERGSTTDVFACAAGAPMLKSVVLRRGQRGAGIYGGCAATLAAVTTTENTHAGLEIASSGAVQVSSGVSDQDDDGVHHHAGSLTITTMEVKGATGANGNGDGVRIVPGIRGSVTTTLTFSATGLSVHDGQGDGLVIDAGAGLTLSGITVSGSSFFKNAAAGLRLRRGSPTFSNIQVYDNGEEGIVSEPGDGRTVTFTQASVTGNCRRERCSGILVNSGSFTLQGTTGAPTIVNDNDGVGVQIRGAAVFAGSGVTVAGNRSIGVLADLRDGGGFACTGCTVAANEGHGYRVASAPAMNGTPGFRLCGGAVTNNGLAGVEGSGRHGILIDALAGRVDAEISGVSVGAHTRGAGLLVFDSGRNNAVTVAGSDFTGNGATVTLFDRSVDVGGVGIVGAVSLSFSGNRVHSNLKHGVSVFGLPGTHIRLGPAECNLTATPPNELFCYGQSNVGVAAYGGVEVDATNNKWSAAPPQADQDFLEASLFPGGAAGNVVVGADCGAIATCP